MSNMMKLQSGKYYHLYLLLEDICEVNDYSKEKMGKSTAGVWMIPETEPSELDSYITQLGKMTEAERKQFAKDPDNAELIEQYHLQDLSLWCMDFDCGWEFTQQVG